MINDTLRTFGLYGFSGTGKTTTIVEIVSNLLKTRLIKSVAFSAPTNKAVNVMKTKFEKYIRELYKIYSHKYLVKIFYLIKEFDFNFKKKFYHQPVIKEIISIKFIEN